MAIQNVNTSTTGLSDPTLQNALDSNLTQAMGIASKSVNPTPEMYGQVADFNDNQTNARKSITGMGQQAGFGQAQQGLNSLGGSGPGGITSQFGTGIGTLGSAAGNIQGMQGNSWTNPGTAQGFMNPYQQGVTNVANTEAARNSAIQGTQDSANAAKAGAFGGSRQGIVDAERNRNLGILQNNNQINGANTAYNTGMQQYNTQQQQQLNQNNALTNAGTAQTNAAGQQVGAQAANAMDQSGVATATQGANLNLAQAQLGVGNQQQALDQTVMNTNQQNAVAAFNQPMQTAGWMQSIIQGSPQAMNSTNTNYAPPPNLGAQLTGLGIAGLGAYGASNANSNSAYGNNGSDPRIKKLIKRVGTTVFNLGLYEWTYIADRTAKRFRGVMSTEVRKVMPEAVVVDRRGFDTVNYRMLGIEMEAV